MTMVFSLQLVVNVWQGITNCLKKYGSKFMMKVIDPYVS